MTPAGGTAEGRPDQDAEESARSASLAQYWRFYWPLALTGVAMVLAVQFQNGALARYPEAVTELAIFALASSTFGLFNAGLNFTSQLANVFARSVPARRASQRFVAVASLVLTAPLALIAATAAGRDAIAWAYGVETALADRVVEYLRYMLPLLFVSAQRLYLTGLLVQARMTGRVTALNVAFLGAAVAALVAGFALGLAPVFTLVGSQAAAGLLHWGCSAAVVRRSVSLPADGSPPTAAELVRFFAPMATTGAMFAISRPVLYAFVGRTPEGIASIAALRVAFDFSSIFQQAANQFRHFFVTFGLSHLAAKRRFMALVCAGITGLMLVVAATPLADWLLGGLLGIPPTVLSPAVEALLVLCLMPAVIIVRNYGHGLLMVRRRTTGMAVGGALRVAAIAAAAQLAHVFGWLDHIAAAAILILGFAVEAAVVQAGAKRVSARGGG